MVEWLHQIIPNELKHKNRNHQPRTSKSWHRARVGVPIHTLQPSQKTSPKVTPACWWCWCTILEGPKRLMKSIRTTSRHNTILAADWTNPFVRSYYVWLYSQIGSFSEVGVKILFKKKNTFWNYHLASQPTNFGVIHTKSPRQSSSPEQLPWHADKGFPLPFWPGELSNTGNGVSSSSSPSSSSNTTDFL